MPTAVLDRHVPAMPVLLGSYIASPRAFRWLTGLVRSLTAAAAATKRRQYLPLTMLSATRDDEFQRVITGGVGAGVAPDQTGLAPRRDN